MTSGHERPPPNPTQRLEAAEIPWTPRLLLEAAAEALDLGVGETRLEVTFVHGKIRYVYEHKRHADGILDEPGKGIG